MMNKVVAKPLIFVCRPGPVGEQLAEAIVALGIQAKHSPSLKIEVLSTTRPEGPYDHYIFISPPAVLASFENEPAWLATNASVFAVGSGTARELAKLGYADVRIPTTFNSEGLLSMPELQTLSESNVLIIKGEGGRRLLQETLLARGASCRDWCVYTRSKAEIDSHHWQAFKAADQVAVTCASIETLDAFESQRKAQNLPIPKQIYVASERIADHAQTVGYTDIIQVGGAANELFIAAIKQHHSIIS